MRRHLSPNIWLSVWSHLEISAVLADVEHNPDHEQLGVRAVLDVHHVDVRGMLRATNLSSARSKETLVRTTRRKRTPKIYARMYHDRTS